MPNAKLVLTCCPHGEWAGEAPVQILAIDKGLSVLNAKLGLTYWVQRHAAGEPPVAISGYR